MRHLVVIALLLLLAVTTIKRVEQARATGMLWIYDAEKSTPEQALVRDNPEWRKVADALAVQWLVIDGKGAEKTYPNAVRHARLKGLPALVFLNRERKKSDVAPAPATVLGVIKLLHDHAGGG
jgi:hypothetical protein